MNRKIVILNEVKDLFFRAMFCSCRSFDSLRSLGMTIRWGLERISHPSNQVLERIRQRAQELGADPEVAVATRPGQAWRILWHP